MDARRMTAILLLVVGVAAAGEVSFSVDKAVFRGDAESARVEFFYSVPYQDLDYEAADSGGVVARYSVRFEMTGPSGFRREGTFFKQATFESFRRAQEQGLQFPDAFSVTVPPGRYRYRVTLAKPGSPAEDTVEGQDVFVPAGSLEDSVVVPDFGAGPGMSSLQLASGVVVHKAGGFTVVPNPTRTYDSLALNQLYFYLEAYNLGTETDSFRVSSAVLTTGETPDTVMYTDPSPRAKTGTSGSTVLGMSVVGLKPGEYVLAVRVEDAGLTRPLERTARFRMAGVEEVYGQTPFRLRMTELEKRYYRELDYIATPKELRYYNSLDDSAKESYLVWFWQRHDLADFARRMRTAEEKFTTARVSGLEEDRGRIYVKYGPPDEIEQAVLEVDRRPREYWFYYTQNHVFVFIDLRSDGVYRLAYTNHRDEPRSMYEKYLTEEEVERFK